MAQQKADIKSMSMEELAAFLAAGGQPAFRAKQVFDWLHAKQAVSFAQMTNLPKALVQKLSEEAYITVHTVEKKLVSKIDGTVKYLFRLPDGEFCESVVMEYKHGKSICISTQVGCRMGCSFCASTKAGFVRHMAASEILEQVYAAQRDLNCRIGHIVLMGIGEPLDNYDNVLRFLSLVSDERGNNISLRHVSLSTCGLVDRIDRLSEERLGLTLSVSLHAPNDAIRGRTMPVSKKMADGNASCGVPPLCGKDGAARLIRICPDPGFTRQHGVRGRACAKAFRHAVPCEPDPGQRNKGNVL